MIRTLSYVLDNDSIDAINRVYQHHGKMTKPKCSVSYHAIVSRLYMTGNS